MVESLKIHMKELERTTAAKERIESELRVATEIQTSMLPTIFPPFPDRKEFDIFATMSPAREVGGDFYDFFFVDQNKLCFDIGDVCGKGIPAALFMAISKTLLKTEALRGLSPEEILTRVNDILSPDNEFSMFFTGFCVILNMENGEMLFANGGHNPPLICTADGEFQFIQMSKSLVVGVMPDVRFECQKLILKPDDVIFMYTDGVTEAENPEKNLFSSDRLKNCLSNLKDRDPTHIIKAIRDEIETFTRGTSQSDDITMLALRFNGKGN
jgi:sigma-B regulation protein RsbU (phosphoserine phosphatase)